MSVEIQQIVIRANASKMGDSDNKKGKEKCCEDESTIENAQKTLDLVTAALNNKKER